MALSHHLCKWDPCFIAFLIHSDTCYLSQIVCCDGLQDILFPCVVVARPTCFRRGVLAPITLRLPRTTHRKSLGSQWSDSQWLWRHRHWSDPRFCTSMPKPKASKKYSSTMPRSSKIRLEPSRNPWLFSTSSTHRRSGSCVHRVVCTCFTEPFSRIGGVCALRCIFCHPSCKEVMFLHPFFWNLCQLTSKLRAFQGACGPSVPAGIPDSLAIVQGRDNVRVANAIFIFRCIRSSNYMSIVGHIATTSPPGKVGTRGARGSRRRWKRVFQRDLCRGNASWLGSSRNEPSSIPF